MGVTKAGCNCLKTCKDNSNEISFLKEGYLRSRTANLKINNNPKNLSPLQKSKNNYMNSITEISEFKLQLKNDINSNSINNNFYVNTKETAQNKIIEEKEEDNKLNDDNYDNINIINYNKNNNSNENNSKTNNLKINTCSSIKYLNDIDKNIFFTDKIKEGEKNFNSPINYEKDWYQYCDDNENEDMIILINSMNNNKGMNHTEEDGQIIEYHGKKFLYIGELDKNQRPKGFGVLYTEGKKYEGNFSNGKLIGLGRYINEEGTCFEGIFENNNLVSKAKIIKFNEKKMKVTYFGEVIDFKKNGKGEENCEEYRYNGEFLGDLRHGYGRLEFLENGDVYEGEFNRGEITGKGLYIWANKQQYEGDFVNGIKHGRGIYKWPDETEYEGDYNNGIREGFGKYKWKDGRVFEGMFKGGKPNGKGKLTFKGKTIICEYINGRPITDIKKEFQQNARDIK